MEVIVRIYLIGLMAFVPSEDGRTVTVVVERAFDGHETAEGHRIEPHLPLFLTRGLCEGDCRPNPETIASFLYNEPGQINTRNALRQLDSALQGGGAWILDDIDLNISFPLESDTASKRLRFGPSPEHDAHWSPSHPFPQDKEEARAFGWIARMSDISPAASRVDPDVFEDQPLLGLAAARFKIDRGSLETYRFVDTGGGIGRLAFQPVPGMSQAASPRAYAQWMALDIPVSVEDCNKGITIEARPFTTGNTRTMTLKSSCTPGSLIEMALVNLPAWQAARRDPVQQPSVVGSHFDLYYKLAEERLETSQHRVPVLVSASTTAEQLEAPTKPPQSPLLESLHLFMSRGVYSHAICVPIVLDPPEGP